MEQPGSGARTDPLPDRDPRRWGTLLLLSAAVLLGMSGWFTATAVAPDLQLRWELDPAQVAWLTTAVQLGFVAGTALAALLNLADIVPARGYFAACAVAAAAANASLLAAPGYAPALVARFLTGVFLAGVYPPSMKMIATWFRSARGLAIGMVVGALTVGKATPYLLKALGGTGLEQVVVGASLAGLTAAALVLVLYRDGPYAFTRPRFSWGLVARIVRHRPTMLAVGGYLGHMWELYAAWSTIGLFYLAFLGAGRQAELASFGMIAAGGVGAVLAGRWADLWGRENTTIAMMAVSGGCALTIGWLGGAGAWVLIPLGLLWGFTIVADSAQFSALVTEVAPDGSVGTALTLQTALGFALTGVAIQATTALVEAVGWGWAYSALALGPALGIAAMARLRRERVSYTVG